MAFSKAQWDVIRRQLMVPNISVRLVVPGHRLTLHSRMDRQRLVTMVYVDEQFRGEWSRDDHPIGRRFYPRRTKRVVARTAAEARYKQLRKIYGNAEARRLAGLDDVVAWHDPWWTSVDRLIDHLRRHEPDIRLAEDA